MIVLYTRIISKKCLKLTLLVISHQGGHQKSFPTILVGRQHDLSTEKIYIYEEKLIFGSPVFFLVEIV